jgi:hypothetical protein
VRDLKNVLRDLVGDPVLYGVSDDLPDSVIEELKAQGHGTYQAQYVCEQQLGNDPTPKEEAT